MPEQQLVILKRRQKAHTVLSTLVFSCIWKRCRQRSFLFSWGRIIYLVFDLGEECIWLKIEQPTRLVIQARLFFTVILRANFSQQKQMSNKLHTSVPTRWAEFANLNPLLFSPNFLDTWTNGKNSFFSVCLNAFNKNYHNNRNTVCELEGKKKQEWWINTFNLVREQSYICGFVHIRMVPAWIKLQSFSFLHTPLHTCFSAFRNTFILTNLLLILLLSSCLESSKALPPFKCSSYECSSSCYTRVILYALIRYSCCTQAFFFCSGVWDIAVIFP